MKNQGLASIKSEFINYIVSLKKCHVVQMGEHLGSHAKGSNTIGYIPK